MSVLGDLYLLRLRHAGSETEFEEEILSILSRIDYRLKKGELTIKAANDLIDEIVKGLLESGFEKRSQFGLEEYGGLEDLHESLSLDNSKSDELLAMAYPRTKSPTKKMNR